MQFQVLQPEELDLSPFQVLEVASRWSRKKAGLPGAIRIDPCLVEAGQETHRYFPGYRNAGDALLHPELEEILHGRGLTRNRPILVSATGPWGPVNGARVAWALCGLGFADVYWLDGGSRAWTSGKRRPDLPGIPAPLHCQAGADSLAGCQLVDVRSRAEYLGVRQNRYRFFRSCGHLPGALWLGDWTGLVRPDRRLRDRAYLQERWQRLGLDREREIVFYCGTGWRSSLACCLALWLGYPRVRNYDGGVYDWISRGLPLVAGKASSRVETSAR